MSFASKIMGNCSNYLKKLDKKDLVWSLLSHQFRMFSVVYTVFATVAELSACSTITKFATTMLKKQTNEWESGNYNFNKHIARRPDHKQRATFHQLVELWRHSGPELHLNCCWHWTLNGAVVLVHTAFLSGYVYHRMSNVFGHLQTMRNALLLIN